MERQELSQVLRVRREKLDALRDRGLEPFAYSFDATDASDAAIASCT